MSPNQKECKNAIYRIIAKLEQPKKTNKPSEVQMEIKMDRQNDNNEQIKVKEQYKELFTRQGRLIGHEVKIEFKQNAKVCQQKGSIIPIQLQEAVQEEIERLLKEGHTEKVTEVTEKEFIQLVVITLRRDKSVKIALHARALNTELGKDKYQMPKLST